MNVLVVAPHTDDEIACAGTIARHVRHGDAVHCLALSSGADDTLPTREEFVRSCLVLGASSSSMREFPTRRFDEHRQQILDELRQHSTLDPERVYVPSSTDCHQDHRVVYEEAHRAFKTRTILGYEAAQNNRTFHATAHVRIGNEDMATKLLAAAAYRSQAHKPYMHRDVMQALAMVRGLQVGSLYAEAFEVIHWAE